MPSLQSPRPLWAAGALHPWAVGSPLAASPGAEQVVSAPRARGRQLWEKLGSSRDEGPGCLFVRIMATASSCERLKQTPLPSGEDPLYGAGDGAFRKEGRGKEKCPWRTGFLWKESHALAEALQGIFRVSKSVFAFRLALLQAHGESYSSVGCEMCPCPPCAHRAHSCSYGWAQAHTVTEALRVCACVRACVRACAQLPRAHSASDVSQGQAGWKG